VTVPEIRGITIAVGDWYARTLEVCLARNLRHLTSCVVVTSPADSAVKEVVAGVPGARLFETDAFTRPDANGVVPRFNKGLAMEEGLDFLGREGWIWIWDADVIFPDEVPLERLQPGKLFGCTRRILEDPSRWRPSLEWSNCARARDGGPIGFTQIFHAADPAIKGRRPWYDVSFAHAGGGDAYFMRLWPRTSWVTLPFDVLHLGPRDSHWFGADAEGRDLMAAFVVRNGWTRRSPCVDRSAVERVGEIVERVEVPGYDKSTFELPFVQRAKERA
jgi:hypothetical protein